MKKNRRGDLKLNLKEYFLQKKQLKPMGNFSIAKDMPTIWFGNILDRNVLPITSKIIIKPIL
jgi:hypothetical protein